MQILKTSNVNLLPFRMRCIPAALDASSWFFIGNWELQLQRIKLLHFSTGTASTAVASRTVYTGLQQPWRPLPSSHAPKLTFEFILSRRGANTTASYTVWIIDERFQQICILRRDEQDKSMHRLSPVLSHLLNLDEAPSQTLETQNSDTFFVTLKGHSSNLQNHRALNQAFG